MPWHSTNGGGGAPATPATVPISIDVGYNVQDYGALGDGSTDDTAEIQACIDAAEAFTIASGRGAVVYFPAGVYRTSAPLTVTKDNIILRGLGRTASGLGTIGTESTTPVTGGSIIQPLASFSGDWIIDVFFDTPSVRALVGNWIIDLLLDAYYVPVGPTGGIRFSVFRGGMRGVLVHRLKMNTVATGPAVEMKCVDDTTVWPKGAWDNVFSSCIFQDSVAPCFYAPGESSDSMITNCIIQSSSSHGMHLAGPGWIVTGNYITGHTGRGIYAPNRQLIVNGNRFRECGGGVEVLPATTPGGSFVINNNTFRNCSEGGDNTQDGITVTASSAANGGIISGNEFVTLDTVLGNRRLRYCINIANANAVGVEIGPNGTGWGTGATGAFGTAFVNDAGTNTRHLYGSRIRTVTTGGTAAVISADGADATTTAKFETNGRTGAAALVTSKLESDSSGRAKVGTTTAHPFDLIQSAAIRATFNTAGDVSWGEGVDFALGTATGTMIGTLATQKLAHWGATPVVQPSATGETVGFVAGAGTAVNDQSTFTGNVGTKAYRISDIVKALKQAGLIASS